MSPSYNRQSPPATVAALPPELPPALLFTSKGFKVAPKILRSPRELEINLNQKLFFPFILPHSKLVHVRFSNNFCTHFQHAFHNISSVRCNVIL